MRAHIRAHRPLILGAAIFLTVAIGSAAAQTKPLTISKTVWENYQAYLTRVGTLGDGYYAVTEDGSGGGSWACGATLCQGSFDGEGAAMQQCQQANPGKTCVLFAKDSTIQMQYEVAP